MCEVYDEYLQLVINTVHSVVSNRETTSIDTNIPSHILELEPYSFETSNIADIPEMCSMGAHHGLWASRCCCVVPRGRVRANKVMQDFQSNN